MSGEKEATLRPATLLRFSDEGYLPPDFKDVRILKAISGKTGSELGKLAGVDGRVVRRWTAELDKQSSNIPYSAWRVLLIECGYIENDEVKFYI